MKKFVLPNAGGALNTKVPVNGYEHLQVGLGIWSEEHRGGIHDTGVVYEEPRSCCFVQKGDDAPAS